MEETLEPSLPEGCAPGEYEIDWKNWPSPESCCVGECGGFRQFAETKCCEHLADAEADDNDDDDDDNAADHVELTHTSTPKVWTLIDDHAYCSAGVRKTLADVTSDEECFRLVEGDPDCVNQMYTNGQLCRCVKVGQTCDFQKSETGSHVYEGTPKDTRELTIAGAGDARANGKVVVSGIHRGRPKYTLADNSKMEIFWSNSKKQWRLVFDNFFGWKRSTVYTNWEDTDLLPLTGWHTLNMHALPIPTIKSGN